MLQVRFGNDTLLEAGIDESGRGCLWGPLYAAAVIWPPEEEWTGDYREIAPLIQDSKKVSPKKRMALAESIKALAVDYGIGSVTTKEIDEHGMTYTNRLVFLRAIDALTVKPDRILVDGILPLPFFELHNRSIQQQETIIEGDGKYLPIAAASILAKEARDAYVKECVEKEPTLESAYSIGSSKGYGTLKHRMAIKEKGKLEDHRNLFLRKLLGTAAAANTAAATATAAPVYAMID